MWAFADMKPARSLIAYLQVAPLFVQLFLFFIVPLALVLVVSFYRYQVMVGLVPDFTFKNYVEILTSATVWKL